MKRFDAGMQIEEVTFKVIIIMVNIIIMFI